LQGATCETAPHLKTEVAFRGAFAVEGAWLYCAATLDREGPQVVLSEYLPILIFLGVAIGFAVVAVGLSMVAVKQNPDSEKVSAYECGFEAFDDARSKFDVRFYLVAILFIIFDLEVAFLFPWAITLGDIGMLGFWSMVAFLGVLTVGFIYEWKKGALEWE
jgi:NADH-quinone oxidoreductase subunit A